MNILQLGCLDGDDHVYEFVNNNLSQINNLIFVDANEKAVKATVERYSKIIDQEKIKGIYSAIVTDDSLKTVKFFMPRKSPICAHSSIFKELVSIDWGDDLEEVIVPAITINNLIDSLLNYCTRIDQLYIDVEGLDADIILDLNLNKYDIPYIQYEAVHTDGHFTMGKKYFSCVDKLKNFGYNLFQHINNYDLVAVKN